MMTRFSHAIRSALLLPVVAALVAFVPTGPASAVAASARPRPVPPTPAYSPPPSEPSPFSSSDTFCVPALDHFDAVAPTDPSVQGAPANVVWLAPPETSAGAPGEMNLVGTFARLVEQCGGIGGRPFAVHVVHQSGDARTDCATIGRYRPEIVVARSTPAGWGCIVRDQRTILLTGSPTANADLTGAGGRLVATDSTEGVQEARLLGLVASGRVDDAKVAVVAGPDAAGIEFERAARAALATRQLHPVDLADADAVLVSSLDQTALPQLEAITANARAGRPLAVYAFEDARSSVPAAVDRMGPVNAEALLRNVQLYAFSPVADARYRATMPPNTFSGMCNRATVEETVKRSSVTSTTVAAEPPLSASFLSTADVCLLVRVAARALFMAGPAPDQRALITALHRLPYVDQAVPAGTPKPRPNEVINEPVRRIEQVVVLSQVDRSCPSASTTTTTTSSPAGTVDACWKVASGWDEGGSVVNVPLRPTLAAVNH